MTYLEITPFDPLIARDGRPFGAGLRMKSLGWFYPSVLSGSLRSMVGKRVDPSFGGDLPARLKNIAVAGLVATHDGSLFFPAPRDIAICGKDGRAFAARPCPVEGGCCLPAGLLPAMLPADLEDDFKPATPPAFWRCEKMAAWLLNPKGAAFEIPRASERPSRRLPASGYLDAFEQERRTHVQIDPSTGAAKQERLFETAGLCFPEGVSIAARVDPGEFAPQMGELRAVHPFGGERRLAHWSTEDRAGAWACPGDVRQSLRRVKKGGGIRMVLATPALFDGGWRPGWIDRGWRGVRLTLIGACVDRWRPISGWSLERGMQGPKPARRLVPAGSVYFFRLEGADGSAGALADAWLEAVSDKPEDQRDGFGLALWGIWS